MLVHFINSIVEGCASYQDLDKIPHAKNKFHIIYKRTLQKKQNYPTFYFEEKKRMISQKYFGSKHSVANQIVA